jgi:hypothetical protein
MKKTIGRAFLLAFGFHVLLSLYLTFVPGKKDVGSSAVAKFYQYFVHLGPFFQPERLQYYRHFVVALKYGDMWREIDLTENEVSGYRENLFAMGHLTKRDFLNHTAREFHAKGRKLNSESFRKLHEFVRTECISNTRPDSVRWIFKQISSSPGAQPAEEVIFTFDYVLSDAEKP